MQKIILCCGIPASGKSTWAKQEVSRDPTSIVRINNDLIRSMLNNSVFNPKIEKVVTNVRNFLIKEALKKDLDIIIDNLNINPKHFNDVVRIAKESNKEVQVIEKVFYIDLEEAIERDSKRQGSEKVGEQVIRKWWKDSGKNSFKHYNPRVEVITARNKKIETVKKQDESLPKLVIFDLDGTMCDISHRNPYDASNCLNDSPNTHVVNLCKLFYQNNHKIIFLSGREDKYRADTMSWLDCHFGGKYELFMRPSNDFRKDSEIKFEIFQREIENKYNVVAVVDDRLQVCQLWHELNLPLFRVGDPEANF